MRKAIKLKPMTAPPLNAPFVPWSIFQWIVTAFGAVIAWLFRRHLIEDDARFKEQEKRIDQKHIENVASLQQMRGDLLAGQSNLASQFSSVRRTLDDVLLQRRE
jgi:hypothetical protein